MYTTPIPTVGAYLSPAYFASSTAYGLGNSLAQGTLQNYTQSQSTQPTVANQVAQNLANMPLIDKIQGTLGTVGSIMQAYNAYNANKLAQKQFNRHIIESDRNYDSQMKLTNSRLADRQARRIQEQGANAVPSVGQYMKQYGIQ